MDKKFPTVWFTNPEDREAIETGLRTSPVIQKLREILDSRLALLETREVSVETYRDLDWSHVQAHFNGQKEELYYLFKLLDQGD